MTNNVITSHNYDFYLLIISGLAGSGKTVIIHALEDIGFYCVDNLPMNLIPVFLDTVTLSNVCLKKIAISVDSRDPNIACNFVKVLQEINAKKIDFFQNNLFSCQKEHLSFKAEFIFVEANDAVIVNRFKLTKRGHPLSIRSNYKNILKLIELDNKIMKPLKIYANRVIDTSHYSGHQLRQYIMREYADNVIDCELKIHLVSFGFKHGVPTDLDTIFDVRCFINPYYLPELKHLTGLTFEVKNYILQDEHIPKFLEYTYNYLNYMLLLYKKDGRTSFSIGIGCTGGKHRSVVITELLAEKIKENNKFVIIEHRHIEKE